MKLLILQVVFVNETPCVNGLTVAESGSHQFSGFVVADLS